MSGLWKGPLLFVEAQVLPSFSLSLQREKGQISITSRYPGLSWSGNVHLDRWRGILWLCVCALQCQKLDERIHLFLTRGLTVTFFSLQNRNVKWINKGVHWADERRMGRREGARIMNYFRPKEWGLGKIPSLKKSYRKSWRLLFFHFSFVFQVKLFLPDFSSSNNDSSSISSAISAHLSIKTAVVRNTVPIFDGKLGLWKLI